MKSVIWIALLSVSAAACSGTGDFGRQRYSVLDDKILPAVKKSVAQTRENPVSWYPLTSDERKMRQTSRLLVTPYGKPVFLERTIGRIERADLVANKIAWNAPERYLGRIKREKFTDGDARVTFINKHISDDQQQFRQFETDVRYVFQTDKKRLLTLRRMRDPGPSDHDNTLGRIEENRQIVSQTLNAIDLRMRGYDKALRRTQLQFPNARIWKAGQRLTDMKSQVDKFAARMRPYLDKETTHLSRGRGGAKSD